MYVYEVYYRIRDLDVPFEDTRVEHREGVVGKNGLAGGRGGGLNLIII